MRIFIIPLFILFFDQATKLWVKANFTPYAPINVLGHYLRITFCENPGMAFGISVGSFHIYITILSLIITIGLIYYLYKERKNNFIYVLSLAFILGGALGNLYDRSMMILYPSIYGGVVDFIDVGLFKYSYRWYIFNIADSAVTIGIILYMYYSYKIENKQII